MYKFIGKAVVSTIGLSTVLCGGIVLGIGGLALVVGKDDTVSKGLIEDCKEFYQKFQETKKTQEKKQINDFLEELKVKTQKTEEEFPKKDNTSYKEWLKSNSF